MAEWLVEAGIGEDRAILLDRGEIRAARIDWGDAAGTLRPGLVAQAQIVARAASSRRGTARFADGAQALVDALPPEATEGSHLMLRVTRAAIAERGRTKLPHARPAPRDTPRPAPGLLDTLRAGTDPVRLLPVTDRAFDDADWDELVEQALTGEIAFTGGSLTISPTPAMTLVDVDGTLPPRQLALAAAPAIAAALGRLDLGGSVGIDFPSLAEKRDRHAVDEAIAAALAQVPDGWRGERTAMNGFGFVQLVSRLERPSLVALLARRPAAAAARMLLRKAERVAEPGRLLLTAHPAVIRATPAHWIDELARRTGRLIEWREQPGLAPAAAFAQALAT
ncbi:ribonuclease E/G [Novosphingobium lentum]|uniref:ribonuclease E/G n=1 Tax=Novosphingobium lentum TaxID=145287 RepID=UPI000836B5C0|nr:ribonuclease E/G [Novosphingobium lentum]